MRPLISSTPGWCLLLNKRKRHPTPGHEGNLGYFRSMSAGLGRFEVVLADRTRLQGSEGHHTPRPQAPRPPETTVFGETAANGGSARSPQKGSSCCARRATRGVRSRFTPLSPADNAADQGALPGGALDQGPSQDRAEHVPRETRVTRGPAEALAASSNAASTDSVNAASAIRTIRRVLVYVGQLQTLTGRIFPQGPGLPKGRQQTSG